MGDSGRHTLWILAVGVAFLSTIATAGQIEKWSDAEGKAHFGNAPPPEVQTTDINVRPAISGHTDANHLAPPIGLVNYKVLESGIGLATLSWRVPVANLTEFTQKFRLEVVFKDVSGYKIVSDHVDVALEPLQRKELTDDLRAVDIKLVEKISRVEAKVLNLRAE